MSTEETGKCEKCASEIPVEAERCPECGYEPASQGILGSLGAALSAGVTILLGGLILIIWVVTIGGSLSITDALTATAFFGFILLFPLGILYASMQKELKTPTGEDKDLKKELFGGE